MSERAERVWTTSYRAAWVLPVAHPPIRNGAVVVEGERIAWVGPAGAEPSLAGTRVVELGHTLLAPGLVNAHTHLDLTLFHGLLDGLDFFAWIRTVVAAREQMTADELLDSARAGVIRGLEAGITTFADTAPIDASFLAMLELGVRGIAYQEVFGPDPASVPDSISGLRERVAALRTRESRLVRIGVSPHAPFSVSDALYQAVGAFARSENLPIAAHLAESEAESQLVAAGSGRFAEFLRSRNIAAEPRARSPVALLDRHGVLGSDALLIHCVRCDADDIAAIARSGAAVATCPRSNRYFAHGRAPVAAMRAAGVRVAAGSDSLASNESMDLITEAALALEGEPGATVADCWRLATLGGAEALGLDGIIGTLEPGKDADLAAFPVAPQAPESGGYPALGRDSRASLAVVSGVERLRKGRVPGDTEGIAVRAAATTVRLKQWRSQATTG